MCFLAEYLRIRFERNRSATPVGGAGTRQFAGGLTTLEAQLVAMLVTEDFHFHPFRQRVDDRSADTVQPAGRVVSLTAEFSPGVERGHDHFKRRLVFEFGVRVDRDAAPVIANGQDIVCREFEFNTRGMTGHGFVHRIVEDFSRQMMQGPFIGAADIHAGAAAHGLQPLKDFNILCCVAFGGRRCRIKQVWCVGHQDLGCESIRRPA